MKTEQTNRSQEDVFNDVIAVEQYMEKRKDPNSKESRRYNNARAALGDCGFEKDLDF